MKVSWSLRLKVQHWQGCLVTCGLQVQITSNHPWTACEPLQWPPSTINYEKQVAGIQWPPYFIGWNSYPSRWPLQSSWWPNQGVIKIHDPFANLVFVSITSLNSTCGQQTLHPIRKWKARLNSHWNQPSLLLDDHDINIAASTTNDKPKSGD